VDSDDGSGLRPAPRAKSDEDDHGCGAAVEHEDPRLQTVDLGRGQVDRDACRRPEQSLIEIVIDWCDAYHPAFASTVARRSTTTSEANMTTDPSEHTAAQTPDVPPTSEGGKQKRPVIWMILTGIAIAVAIGLGVWAIVLNDDLNDTEAQLDAQTAAAQSASAEAQGRIADARSRIQAALSGVAGVVVVTDQDVTEAEQAIAKAEQSVADAQAAVDQAQGEVEQARAERDLAKAEAEQARAEAQKAELCADASDAATQALAESSASADDYEKAAASAETAASACS
jgi:hypothetical protein